MNSKRDKKQGQILLVTLLVLTIVAIVIVGVVLVINRDVNQIANTDKYQQLLNVSEVQLQQFVEEYAESQTDLSTINANPELFNSLDGCTVATLEFSEVEAVCNLNNSQIIDGEINSELRIKDQKNVEDYEILKDEVFSLALYDNDYRNQVGGAVNYGYRSGIYISWEGDFAIEIDIDVSTGIRGGNETNFRTFKDVYDPTGVLDSFRASVDTSIGTLRIEPDSESPNNKFYMNTDTLRQNRLFGNADSVIRLRITPRSNTELATKLNVEFESPGLIPNQMRVFRVNTSDSEDPGTPIINVLSQIPLTPQIPSIFNYTYITDGDLIPPASR